MPTTTRLANSEAIRQFNAKIPHIGQIKAYQHALAFSVAGIAKKDMLSDIHTAISQAIEGGIDFDEFKKSLIPYLTAKGYLDTNLQLGGHRLQLIFDTNKKTAYAAGRWERLQRTKKTFPYLQYMPSVSTQKRHEHKQYYGLIAHIDDPIWQSIYPPNGFNCRCSVRALTQKQADKILAEQQADGKTFDKSVNAVTPRFRSNHDRLSAMLRLAQEKHGGGFGDKLKQDLGRYMVDYAKDRGVKVVDFGGIIPRQREIERLAKELDGTISKSEGVVADEWQQHYGVLLERFNPNVHKVLISNHPADFVIMQQGVSPKDLTTLDFMFTMSNDNTIGIEAMNWSISGHKRHKKNWQDLQQQIINHSNKADIIPLDLRHWNVQNRVKIIAFVLSLPKDKQKQIVLIGD